MKEKEKNEFVITPGMHFAVRSLALALAFLLIFLAGRAAITFCLGLFADGDHIVQLPGQESPVVDPDDIPHALKPIYVDSSQVMEIARADITVAGDLMLHLPIVRTSQTTDGYDFSDIFRYVQEYVSDANYAVVNLETTLSGSEGKEFTGYPDFNSPDQIALNAKNAGFDMLLTGNNHIYDYGTDGLKRTMSIIRGFGLDYLGTVESAEDTRHAIQNIGGVKVGMACYTFADIDDKGNVKVNGHKTDSAAAGLINAFDYDKLSHFYTEVEGELAAMKANGADALVVYIHWGDEYSSVINEKQREIAQQLCDMGVNVLVGTHPHVVQPVELMSVSMEPARKMICVYSAGTLLSNLRADTINMETSHCEDGLLFNFTLSKYSDGTTRVSAVNLIPTWVMVKGSGEDRDFYILPLDKSVEDWKTAFNLTDEQLSDAKNSHSRTMALVTSGLHQITSYLTDKNSALDPSLGVG